MLEQHFDTGDAKNFYIHQDLVLALGLLRKGDIWIRPEEDDVEVVRIKRNDDGTVFLVEIRSEQLRDYLCAAKCGLLVSRFHSRSEVSMNHVAGLPTNELKRIEEDHYRWDGGNMEIHEGGERLGSTTAVFLARRTDVHYEDDVPKYEIGDSDSIESSQTEYSHQERKLYRTTGELWKNDWVDEAERSTRVRRDSVSSTIPFIIENDGTTAVSDEFMNQIRWLWFRPGVALELMKRRNAILTWHSCDTGHIGPDRCYSVHFGLNTVGFINVFAKDIALLPEIYKRIWASHNATPEGGVSKELLMSQMECNPADTLSPERAFLMAIRELQAAFRKRYDLELFQSHYLTQETHKRVHRFHGINREGIFTLSKEIVRLSIECIRIASLRSVQTIKDNSIGTIKLLERMLDHLVPYIINSVLDFGNLSSFHIMPI